MQCAQRSANPGEAVGDIVSNRRSNVAGALRISAPLSISDSLLVPLINGFQGSYLMFVSRFSLLTGGAILVEGMDSVFRLGALKDSTLVARRILTYRHQLVASPELRHWPSASSS
jgi:DNA-binding transcriptional LysR family regulator